MAPTSAETRTSVSILDRSTGQLTEVYERGAAIDDAAWTGLEAILRDELGRGDVAALALSGSLPPGAPPDGYARIARIAAASARPTPVLADTYGPALAAVLPETPSVVKLNGIEAGEATGIAVSDVHTAVTAASLLREAGASTVIVTLGLAGAVVVSRDGRIQLIPPEIPGPYPVGSGDAFLGGLAVAFARGESLLDAGRLGMAAGIANAQRPGAGSLDPVAIDPIRQRVTAISI